MSSERKTIQINPELFKVSSATRKKSSNPGGRQQEPRVQIRSSFKNQRQKTLRKNVLKMIREKQQEAYRDLFDSKKQTRPSTTAESSFNKEFDDSLNFFSSLATKIDAEERAPLNTTFKNLASVASTAPSLTPSFTPSFTPSLTPSLSPSLTPSLAPSFTPISVNTSLPEALIQTPSLQEPPLVIPTLPRILPPPPSYGCLKGGALPTYRSYTRHMPDGAVQPQPQPPVMQANTESYNAPPQVTNPFAEQMHKFEKIHGGVIDRSTGGVIDRSTGGVITGSTGSANKESKIKYLKRKKIFKRTYHVGRSKGSVGVLVSNKTIRTRISTQAQLLKQTPIQDVRRFLIKKGFIKVGTNAPNDVLRKMYESVSLVCGELENHNQDNLLFNFINDTSV